MRKKAVKYGVFIAFIIIAIWYTWATYYYRYSEERIRPKILSRYAILNPPPKNMIYKIVSIDINQVSNDITFTLSTNSLETSLNIDNEQNITDKYTFSDLNL